MRVLSIGDRVPNGAFRLHSRFERVVNFTDGVGIVSIVTPEIGAGPIDLVVDGFVETPRSLFIAGDGGAGRAVAVDRRTLDTAHATLYQSRIDLARWDARTLAGNLDVLCRLLIAEAPKKSLAFLLDRSRAAEFRPGFERSIAAHIADGARDAVHGDILRATHRLSGCGFGLTPSGDDFICGLLIAMHVSEAATDVSLEPLRNEVRDIARTGNVLTDTFLTLACEGAVSERTQGLLRALLAGSRDDVVAAARLTIAVGETSGADFATGLLMQLRAYAVPARTVLPAWARATCGAGDMGFRC